MWQQFARLDGTCVVRLSITIRAAHRDGERKLSRGLLCLDTPEWGSLDILTGRGPVDPGSNPGSGAIGRFMRIEEISFLNLIASG